MRRSTATRGLLLTALGLLLAGCGLFRAPPTPVDCRLPEPPAALLVVPAPLPALPVDLPARRP